MAKAAVLPVPVWAWPIKSTPARARGISPAWIGVGSRYSASSSAASMTCDRPMAAKAEGGRASAPVVPPRATGLAGATRLAAGVSTAAAARSLGGAGGPLGAVAVGGLGWAVGCLACVAGGLGCVRLSGLSAGLSGLSAGLFPASAGLSGPSAGRLRAERWAVWAER